MLADAVSDIKLVRLDASASRRARSLLFNAYRHEPTFKFLFDAGAPGYDQRVRATIREGIDLHFAHDQDAIGLVKDDALVAVAFVSTSGLRIDLSEHMGWRMKMMLTAGWSSTQRYIDYHRQVTACFPEKHFNQLPLIGVDPKYQNQGCGRRLLEAVHKLAENNPVSAGVGLDTGNHRYLDFYQSMGYQKVGEVSLGQVKEAVLFRPNRS